MENKWRNVDLIFFTIFALVATCICKVKRRQDAFAKSVESNQKVLLIGLDGWRWDFVPLHKAKLPNIVDLESKGVRAGFVQNVFPTNTYPNFYSVVTGLYPEHHGIIDNQMYDVERKEKFNMKTTKSTWWNQAEPIWITNQKQGHHSGLCYWPGFNVMIKGDLPTYVADAKKYINPVVEFSGQTMPHKERIDLSLGWLKKPEVTFAAIYFENIDMKIHGSGDKSIHDAMATLDDTFGYLKEKLESLALSKDVNVIVIGKGQFSSFPFSFFFLFSFFSFHFPVSSPHTWICQCS